LEFVVRRFKEEWTESPEFLLKASIDRVIEGMKHVVRCIPESAENAVVLVQVLGKVIGRLNLVGEPRFEERSLFAIGI
jgi:hypothetical protein